MKVNLKTVNSVDLSVLLTTKASAKLAIGNQTKPQKNGMFLSLDLTASLLNIIKTALSNHPKVCTSETISNGTTSSPSSKSTTTTKIILKKNSEGKFNLFKRNDEIKIKIKIKKSYKI